MKEVLLINYFFSLFKKLHELQAIQKENSFRIVSIEERTENECLLKIQIVGKSTIFEATPQELAANDILLEGFSKKDVRTITYYATKEIIQPPYKILVQEFEEKTNRSLFKLGRRGEPSPVERTAEQIYGDKDLLHQISQEDAHMLGYIMAMELIVKEKEEIEKLKVNQ